MNYYEQLGELTDRWLQAVARDHALRQALDFYPFESDVEFEDAKSSLDLLYKTFDQASKEAEEAAQRMLEYVALSEVEPNANEWLSLQWSYKGSKVVPHG